MEDQPSSSRADTGETRKNRRFVVWSTGLLVACVILVALIAQFSVFGEGFHAVTAVILGIGGTIGLSVALMALVFHSARSGHDDEIER